MDMGSLLCSALVVCVGDVTASRLLLRLLVWEMIWR